jgi:hypothetical protein
MKYSIGDIVKFKLESGEIEKGDVQFIEKKRRERILYINSFSRWAYKVPEKRIISRVRVKK